MEESTSLWVRLRASLRLTRRALGLIWSNSPTLLLLLLALVALQSVLPALGLTLSKLVIDRAGADLGLVVQPDQPALRMPLAVWIGAAALSLALGQALLALAATVQSLIGDRVSVATARALMLATACWPGLRQIEDPALGWSRAASSSRAPMPSCSCAAAAIPSCGRCRPGATARRTKATPRSLPSRIWCRDR